MAVTNDHIFFLIFPIFLFMKKEGMQNIKGGIAPPDLL